MQAYNYKYGGSSTKVGFSKMMLEDALNYDKKMKDRFEVKRVSIKH